MLSNYRIKWKIPLIFISLILSAIVLKSNFEFKNKFLQFVDNEIQVFQASFNLFSSVRNMFDDGSFSSSTLDYIGELHGRDFLDLFSRFGNINRDTQAPKIDLEIKFKHLDTIKRDRLNAIKNKRLIDPAEVPCKAIFNGTITKCSVRLKGDLHDHWNAQKRLSLKLRLKGGKSNFLGYRKFSLVKPRARQYPYDYSFQNLAKRMGILSSAEQRIVEVSINGDSNGLMLLEESVSKDFLERRNRKDSLIFRLGGQKNWKPKEDQPISFISHPKISLNVVGNDRKILRNTRNREVYSYVKNKILTEQTLLSRKQTLKTFLLALSWGNIHPLFEHNSWYYYNPYSKDLEPILTDQGKFLKIDLPTISHMLNRIPWYYIQSLDKNRFSSEELVEITSEIKKNIPLVEKDLHKYKKFFPLDRYISTKILEKNIDFLLKNSEQVVSVINSSISNQIEGELLNPKRVEASNYKLLDSFVYVEHKSNGMIDIYNLLSRPVFVSSYYFQGETFHINRTIPPSSFHSLSMISIHSNIKGIQDRKVLVKSSINGIERLDSNEFSLIVDSPYPNIKKEVCSLGKLDSENHCLIESDIKIYKDIIFNEKTIIKSGVTIEIFNSSNLKFLGGLETYGEQGNRIKFISNSGGGIYVDNSLGQRTIIKNTDFYGLSEYSFGAEVYTGGVNIFGGKAYIENVLINNANGEDAMNIVSSEVDIDNLIITNTKSDALDCDFCSGKINTIEFSNIGGDGIDLSGSNLSIKSIKAKFIKDKAVSVGEKTNLLIENAVIHESSTAIAVKDGSNSEVQRIKVYPRNDGAQTPQLITYNKKPIYSQFSSELLIHKISPKEIPLKCENGSKLIVSGKLCANETIDVKEMYETYMKK